jgi:hypothetical protein
MPPDELGRVRSISLDSEPNIAVEGLVVDAIRFAEIHLLQSPRPITLFS